MPTSREPRHPDQARVNPTTHPPVVDPETPPIAPARALRSSTPMRFALALPIAFSLLLASCIGLADETPAPAEPPPDPPPPTHVWYGYQTLATDGVALALLLPAAASVNTPGQQGFEMGSLVMYAVAAPLVHFSHGNVGKGFADLGLRVGLPVVSGLVGVGIVEALPRPDCNNPANASATACQPFGLLAEVVFGGVLGVATGVVTAITFDAAVLGRETVPADAPSRSVTQPVIASIAPTFSVVPEGQGGSRTSFGVVGTF
jgi:hypothetical protein